MKPAWEAEGVQLYLGDCTTLDWEAMGGFHALIMDPPYGIALKSHGQHFMSADVIAGDESTEATMSVLNMAAGSSIACFFSPYVPLPIQWRSVLCWAKGPQVGIGGDRKTCWKRDIEMIGIRDNAPLNGKRDSALLDMFPSAVKKPSGHVAEKPVGLMRYLVEKLTQPGQTVFDPFMGGGSTGVACVLSGRRFVGAEIGPKHFAVAVKRIERALAERAAQLPFAEAEK